MNACVGYAVSAGRTTRMSRMAAYQTKGHNMTSGENGDKLQRHVMAAGSGATLFMDLYHANVVWSEVDAPDDLAQQTVESYREGLAGGVEFLPAENYQCVVYARGNKGRIYLEYGNGIDGAIRFYDKEEAFKYLPDACAAYWRKHG